MFSGRALDLKAHPAVKCDGSGVHGGSNTANDGASKTAKGVEKGRVEPASETASAIIEINRDKVDAGALGYVLERRMATDLPLAIEAALKVNAFSPPLLPNPIDNPPHSLDISYSTFCPWPKLGCVREIFLPKLGRSTVA